MRIARYILWILVIIVSTAAAYFYVTERPFSSGAKQVTAIKLGGEFELLRHDGEKISDKDLLGKPHAIFFGFTNCPEVCPTTLYEMTDWLEKLAQDANRLDVYFMTVDPQRDDVEHLAQYLSSFDSRIIGITGEKKKVEQALRSFNVYFKRADNPKEGNNEDGEYSVDHTASIFLLNAAGEFVGTIAYGESGETAVKKLRRLASK